VNVRDERWPRWLAFVALGIALTPIVVAVGRAVASGWAPTFDGGYFTVRSRDVLTSHHPWLGAWSSGSASVGATIHNLGPMQFDLLAPFTKVDPYWGTAVGVGVVAAASVVAVWWAAHRVLGPAGAGAAMLATLALEATIGTQAFIDPRQHIYLLMPYWALLWLTWAAAAGQGAAIPPLVFAASLITQTHFTYLLQTAVLVLVGVGLYVAAVQSRWRSANATRWLLLGLAVAVVCWAQPLWDQVAGERNLAAVLTNRGAGEGVGWSTGAKFLASAVLVPPDFWRPGTMDQLHLLGDVSQPAAWGAIVLWFAALAVAAVVAWARGRRALAMIPVVGAVALVAAVVAGAAIPLSVFGHAPQNYFWMWPTGAFLTVGLLAGVLSGLPAVGRGLASAPGVLGLVVASLVVSIVAVRPIDRFSFVPSARTAGERVARPVIDELADALRRHDVTGPVVVDTSRASFGSHVPYTMLAELQRAGIEFTFPADHTSLHRFGQDRCEHGQAKGQIVLADAGGDPFARPGETVLVHVDAFSDPDAAQLEMLDRSFGEWLREGTVILDSDAYEFLFDASPPGYAEVMSTPGRPATGLAPRFASAQLFGLVNVPGHLDDEFERWVDLQTRAGLDDVTILLAPPPAVEPPPGGVRALACLD
jgi:hypothetical protein